MVPSLFMISHSTPAFCKPAKSIKSTAASVCPLRVNTPPSIARSGNIWPGREKLSASIRESAKPLTVFDRSAAEIPVVVPCLKSTDVVKGVACKESLSLSATIRSKFNSFARCSVIAVQIKPLPCVDMKLIISGVHLSAAPMKSPSFSRASSSTTTINLPLRKSISASEIVLNLTSATGHNSIEIFKIFNI